LLEVHEAPCTHATHAPVGPPHTPGEPAAVQAVPAGWNVWSLQTGAPVEQSIEAETAQGFAEVHAVPAAHSLHRALVPLHAPARPDGAVQAVPAAWKVWSLQTGVPVEQSIAAVAAQGFDDVHVAPSAHAEHTPLGPVGPLPQNAVPAPPLQSVPAALNVRSLQTGAPVEQSIAADRAQGFVEVHAAPWAHAPQTPFGPLGAPQKEVPAPPLQSVPASLNVWSLQTGAPVEQSIVAEAAQAFIDVQDVPVEQAVQLPVASQTPLAPVAVVQAVPGGELDRTLHTGEPLVQSIEALVAHGFDDVQGPPQRWKCQAVRSAPSPWLAQSMV
jgi:hypothetical protein